VYLMDAGVDLSQEDLTHLAFDDATQQLLAVKGGHVFAYACEGGALRWMYPLQVCARVRVRASARMGAHAYRWHARARLVRRLSVCARNEQISAGRAPPISD
jgi:hypothetical protein